MPQISILPFSPYSKEVEDFFPKSKYPLVMPEKPCNAKISKPDVCNPRRQKSREEIKTSTDSVPEVATAGRFKAAASHVDYPELLWPVGVTPFPFQMKATRFAIKRLETHSSVYLALEAGLGKTICAALLSNYFNKKTPTKIFYVCPPFLVSNTDSEFNTWCLSKNLYLIPDSRLSKKATAETTLENMENELDAWGGETLLIIDEAHRFKNATTGRTKTLMKKILPRFKKSVWLSGTPLPNSRAKEMWPVLEHAAKDTFGSRFFPYGLKYCGGYKNDFGWDFDGFTNRKEWKARIQRSFMLRLKKDVLDLPPKMEGLLTVGEGLPPVISKVEREILKAYSPEDLMQGKIARQAHGEGATELHLATYLRLLGEYKVKYAIPVIESILEETTDNILIFAVHKDTIAKLRYALTDYDPLIITGDVPVKERQGIVKEFQTNPKRRVFLGNIQACGVGFTLTKATRVLFVEFSWVDGDNSQASDRAHRIGQTGTVSVQYVVLKDSIDRQRMELLLNKRRLGI